MSVFAVLVSGAVGSVWWLNLPMRSILMRLEV